MLVGEAIQPSAAQADITDIPGARGGANGTATASEEGAFAIGVSATADALNSTAIGYEAITGVKGTAVIKNTLLSNDKKRKTKVTGGILLNNAAVYAYGKQSIAIGNGSNASADGALAIGDQARAGLIEDFEGNFGNNDLRENGTYYRGGNAVAIGTSILLI